MNADSTKRSLRAIATFGGFIKLSIYYLCDIPAGPWLESPMCQFYIGLTVLLDITYPCLYYAMRQQEKRNVSAEKKIR
jgi:paspaline synthase